ncbi:MAG: substrate-binding domain-containing protein [Gammaproteobacteria bacterium]|nr:substrate-binding domain-containing protein [Gammaproteobacteria bacterium]
MATRALSRLACRALIVLVACAIGSAPAAADDTHILLQSTTSTQVSGLFDDLLPRFEAASGIEVRVVAVGTGQALRNAADGNGDVVLVHARAAEEAFIAAGHGVARHPVMYNEFVIVGPAADPAGVAAASGAADAFARIAARGALFVSRGDDSGTHQRERALWKAAGAQPDGAHDTWYRDTGSGMGRTLQVAAELGGYTLSDRASWIAQRDKGGLRVLYRGDPALFNQYSLILVDPARHPQVKAAAAQAFIDWMLGDAGQAAIAAFRRDGEQLYFPNAGAE